MKRQETLANELKSYGFAHGVKFIDPQKTPYGLEDLDEIYEQKRWNFAAGDNAVRIAYPEPSLLGLPVELRIQILEHLLPDKDKIGLRDLPHRRRPTESIRLWRDAQKGIWHGLAFRKQHDTLLAWQGEIMQGYSSLRKDLQSCWPAVLRVNRQLYTEVAQILYQGRCFTAELKLDELRIFSRDFRIGLGRSDYNMLESQLRHVQDLKILIDAEDYHCVSSHKGLERDTTQGRDPVRCSRLGCDRKRMDGIRNIAAFLSRCVGLRCLHIDLALWDYSSYNVRKTAHRRVLARMETKLLKLLEPFSNIRGLYWAKFSVNNEDPRDLKNVGLEFVTALDTMEASMVRGEPAPGRSDMPETKLAFQTIFSTNLHHRELVKQRLDINIDVLAESCWQACDAGDREGAMTQYKILARAWEEQKAVVESLLRQIGEGTLDRPSVKDEGYPIRKEDAAGKNRRRGEITSAK